MKVPYPQKSANITRLFHPNCVKAIYNIRQLNTGSYIINHKHLNLPEVIVLLRRNLKISNYNPNKQVRCKERMTINTI